MGTKILGSALYLSLLRPFLYVCNLEENLLFSTLILGTVFNDYVVFCGDSTFVQNLATLASAGPEIEMWASKLKMCYVTLTTPNLGWFVIRKLCKI